MGRSAKPTCQRSSKPHPATTTERFSFSGSTYEIDVCDAHADELYRDFFSWARLGRDVSAVERARLSAEKRAATVAFPVMRRVEAQDEPVAPKFRTVLSDLPPKAERWGLTDHARERCELRGVTREQALWAAVDPATDRPSHTGDPSLRVRKRGTIVAVVNVDTESILTVWDAAAPQNEQQQELDYAAHHAA